MLIVCGSVCGLCSVQTINDDLNASLATADELSKEFNSMFNEVSSNKNATKSGSQVCTYRSTGFLLLAVSYHSLFSPKPSVESNQLSVVTNILLVFLNHIP